jgi:hypothetical protein
MVVGFVPTNTLNTLVIRATGQFASSSTAKLIMALFQDSTADALTTCERIQDGSLSVDPDEQSLCFTMKAATTSYTEFKIRAGNTSAGTTTFNGGASARKFGGTMNSFIEVEEIPTQLEA